MRPLLKHHTQSLSLNYLFVTLSDSIRSHCTKCNQCKMQSRPQQMMERQRCFQLSSVKGAVKSSQWCIRSVLAPEKEGFHRFSQTMKN